MQTLLIAQSNESASDAIRWGLEAHLRCRTIIASDSATCFRVLKDRQADMLILDAQVGEPDGFMTCSILKGDEQTRDIPVLLLLEGMKDKKKGLEAGADDYLVKPFDLLDLVPRAGIMLRIKRLTDQAAAGGKVVNRLSGVMAHKLRSPLNSVIGMAELLQRPFYGELSEKQKGFAEIISRSGRQLLDLINEFEQEA